MMGLCDECIDLCKGMHLTHLLLDCSPLLRLPACLRLPRPAAILALHTDKLHVKSGLASPMPFCIRQCHHHLKHFKDIRMPNR